MAGYAETVRKVLDGAFDDASPGERDEAVSNMVNVCSVTAAAVAIQPIPFLDMALIAPIQIALVQAIARIYGYHLDKKAVLEVLSAFGASIVAQNVIMAAAKFVPFLGWVVAPSMAFALTWALGEVADHYFRNGRGVPAEELREMFKKAYRSKRAEKESANKDNSTLRDKLKQLQDAYDAGLIDDETFNRKKEDLLSAF
ncbi:MAG: DUF697 domain-containing protein [Proteobacteria bacterium]|jgi:uncharacterized protein (DUF697 family)|nr:DUF697 domain-containing protein [Pseudomonadota bacterium]